MLVSGVWIIFSDQALLWLVQDPRLLTRLQTAKGWFFVVGSAGIIDWLVRRNIRALRREDEKLREIAQGVSVASGEAFFTSLTRHLAKALDADCTLICELTGEDRATMKTLAAYAEGTFIENFECRLSGTPCENVVEGRQLCSYPRGVRQRFPRQQLLEQFGVESFIGAPLIDSTGETVGLMVVMNMKPLQEMEVAEEILPVFAVRAAVELERRRGEEALRNDITERKMLEEALRTQFDQITTIFDSLNAVVYVADLESYELLYLNRYGAAVFRENWHGNTCCEVLHTGRTGPCESCPSNQLVRDGVPQSPCIWESHNPATGRWYQCIDKAIRWTDGRWVRMEIAVDITELKMLEQMKMDMVSVLTHEIRTPLTAMMGYTDLLLGHEMEAAQQEACLTTIQNETKRLNELIDDFLDMQRLEATLLTHDHSPLPVHHLLQQAASLFSAASDKHRIIVDCPPDLPQIRGDEQQLQRAFKNLLSNAVKYSPKGGAVSLGARQDGDDIVIWVKDEGLGIPPEALDKVFDKFFRVNSPEHRMVRGTGLGLALVRETMEAHGGRVWVESQVGAGSTFYVTLPAMVNGSDPAMPDPLPRDV